MTLYVTPFRVTMFLCIGIPLVIGFYYSIKYNNFLNVVMWGMIGWILAMGGCGFFAVTEEIERKEAAVETIETKLKTMPEDWQNLYTLLESVDTTPLRQAYVTDFISDKEEPEISADAWETFYSSNSCGKWVKGDCHAWRGWLAKELRPFAIVDVDAAMESE